MNKRICEVIDNKKDKLTTLSDSIWNVPETAFTEFESVKLLCDALKSEGFEVEKGVGGVETAFTGKYGKGKPVIGILGEFDALSGLSQMAGCAEKQPVVAGGNGHGCGHHLLGTAGIAAAIAIKDYLETSGKDGTVIFFGCPGEEGGSGKAFMAREGV
ncbi:MAG: amidohydrolase, partial [Oscillospiraceae bacterium]|nr:amidohydrolase [Oscillospiraceae bacterium]